MERAVHERREWIRTALDLARREERAEVEAQRACEGARLALGPPQQQRQRSAARLSRAARNEFVGEFRRITAALSAAVAARNAANAAPLIELFETRLAAVQDEQRREFAALCDEEALAVHALAELDAAIKAATTTKKTATTKKKRSQQQQQHQQQQRQQRR